MLDAVRYPHSFFFHAGVREFGRRQPAVRDRGWKHRERLLSSMLMSCVNGFSTSWNFALPSRPPFMPSVRLPRRAAQQVDEFQLMNYPISDLGR